MVTSEAKRRRASAGGTLDLRSEVKRLLEIEESGLGWIKVGSRPLGRAGRGAVRNAKNGRSLSSQ